MHKRALILVAMLLMASGCAVSLEEVGKVLDTIDDQTSGGTPEAVALLADATKTSAGISVRGTVTVDSPLGGDTDQQWVSQFEYNADGSLLMTVPAPPGTGDASSPPAGGGSELRYVGGTAYVRVPKADVAAKGVDVSGIDGEWVWLTATAAAVDDMDPGFPLTGLCSMPPTADAGLPCDPLQAVGSLIGIAGNARITGSEEIRGALATKVAFTLPLLTMDGTDDTAAGDGSDPAVEDGSLSDFLTQLASAGVGAETWVGDDKLIRRFSLDLTSMLTDTSADQASPSRILVDFYDFNADISVVAPTAELVVGDFTSLGM